VIKKKDYSNDDRNIRVDSLGILYWMVVKINSPQVMTQGVKIPTFRTGVFRDGEKTAYPMMEFRDDDHFNRITADACRRYAWRSMNEKGHPRLKATETRCV
jgi:hypothetical protein